MAKERSIVQSIEPLFVLDVFLRQLVLEYDLSYNFVTETARKHQRRDSILGNCEVHVDFIVNGP